MELVGWIVALIAIIVLAFFLVGPSRVWRQLAGDPDMGAQTLATLKRTGKPNDALLGPEDGLASLPDSPTPRFDLPAAQLFGTILSRVGETETVRWVERDTNTLYARGITTSPLMRFPDTNHIWVRPVGTADGEERSTLVLYAAAQLGRSDLGKNRERLDRWLSLLDDLPRSD